MVVRPGTRKARACIVLSLVATVLLLAASDAHAANGRGQYAVRGAGLVNCADFNQARGKHGDVYLVVAAWIDGYITGVNQYAANTYDVAPFESTELFMTILGGYCEDHPKDPVFGVLLDSFKQLWPDRLIHESEKIPITGSGHETRLYVEIIERVQRKLESAGYYKGPVNGAFSPGTVDALKEFQESIGFKATGFPDQATLWRLLRGKGGSNSKTHVHD